ncbi:flagellar basal-body MS-ring/collar protein FliF [Phosphitispora sp. TUW77]|uniref:flagellar basal-body MS-ring/collar protein FliF n=1 Tax=Phosphitispora sp. TUW77 TaxID=3152361 RepID=UPI003AB13B35
MKEYLLQLKTQAIELWQKMNKTQRTIIVGSAALLMLVLTLLTRSATMPDYGALFTLKDEQQAGQIVEMLNEKKISFKLADNGTDGTVTVMIPNKDITQTRLELASEGLPTGGVVGFESFDDTKFGETDTDRQARYLRALQGELTRTIEGMSEVDTARVHIVQPEPSLFSERQENATAAVMLKFRPNKTLKENQVAGIIKLVTNSVEGLKEENVTIVDINGNILSENMSGSEDGAISGKQVEIRQQYQKQYQSELQNSVESMLEKIWGPGKVVCRVSLEIDFDKIEQKKQEFGDAVPRSTEESEKTSTTTSNSTGSGVPGTDSNIPGYETAGETGSSETTETHEIRNNEINTYEEFREVAPGGVKRMSVAVVIDREINSNQQKVVEDIVKSAAGFNTDRGDQLSVAGMPFSTEYQDELNKQIAEAEKREMYIYGGAAALATIVFIGVIVGSIVVMRRRKEGEALLEEQLMPNRALSIDELDDANIPERDLTPEEKELKRIKERVENVAKEQPDDIAQLLRTWLIEE